MWQRCAVVVARARRIWEQFKSPVKVFLDGKEAFNGRNDTALDGMYAESCSLCLRPALLPGFLLTISLGDVFGSPLYLFGACDVAGTSEMRTSTSRSSTF